MSEELDYTLFDETPEEPATATAVCTTQRSTVYNYVSAFEAHATDLDTKFYIHDIEQVLVTVFPYLLLTKITGNLSLFFSLYQMVQASAFCFHFDQ